MNADKAENPNKTPWFWFIRVCEHQILSAS